MTDMAPDAAAATAAVDDDAGRLLNRPVEAADGRIC